MQKSELMTGGEEAFTFAERLMTDCGLVSRLHGVCRRFEWDRVAPRIRADFLNLSPSDRAGVRVFWREYVASYQTWGRAYPLDVKALLQEAQ